MKRIRFSHNWGHKLDCDVFTTIRRWREAKEDYYSASIGEVFKILVDDHNYGRARLVDVERKTYGLIDEYTLMTDVGTASMKAIHETFKDFGVTEDTEVLILTFQKVI